MSILRSSHIIRYDLDWLHFGFATCALGRENLASLIGAKMSTSIRGYDIAIYPKINVDVMSFFGKNWTNFTIYQMTYLVLRK